MTRRGFLQSALLSLTLITTRRFASPILVPKPIPVPLDGERLFMLAGRRKYRADTLWLPSETFLRIDRGYDWVEILNGRAPMPEDAYSITDDFTLEEYIPDPSFMCGRMASDPRQYAT